MQGLVTQAVGPKWVWIHWVQRGLNGRSGPKCIDFAKVPCGLGGITVLVPRGNMGDGCMGGVKYDADGNVLPLDQQCPAEPNVRRCVTFVVDE